MVTATYEYQRLEKSFLRYVKKVHAEYDFTLDYRALAEELGVKVKDGKRDAYFATPDGQSIVIIEPRQADTRSRFTGFHELSHHFIHVGQDGAFRTFLNQLYGAPENSNRGLRIQAEESLCYKAAALLLMPDRIMQDVLRKVGHTPMGVLELADQTEASLSAAIRRLVWMHDIPVHAFLMSTAGYVEDAIAHGGRRAKYAPKPGYTVDIEHELRRTPFHHRKEDTFEAPVPFKGNTNWRSKVRAVADLERRVVVAYFMDSFELQTRGETPLFSGFTS